MNVTDDNISTRKMTHKRK